MMILGGTYPPKPPSVKGQPLTIPIILFFSFKFNWSIPSDNKFNDFFKHLKSHTRTAKAFLGTFKNRPATGKKFLSLHYATLQKFFS